MTVNNLLISQQSCAGILQNIKDSKIIFCYEPRLSMKDVTGSTFIYQPIAAILTMLDGEHVEQCSRYLMANMSSNAHDV